MSDTTGLHVQLTADAGNFSQVITNAKNKLVDLAGQTRLLKQAESDIRAELEKAKKKYGETSTQVKRLTDDLMDNARGQEKLRQEIAEVNDEINQSTNAYKKAAQAAEKNFDASAKGADKAASTIKSGFLTIKGLIVGYAGKKLYDVLIGSNEEFEQSITSFEVLLQSADKAEELMDKLDKFGAATPFELPDLTDATKQLLAFGTAEEDVMTRLQQLGDLSAGQADILERITLAYGKMLAKGKVSLEELNMFTEAGVPILEQLSKQLNVTKEDLFSLISDGAINVNHINAAMESMTTAGGQFFGMMEKQSKTFGGMLSTMSDNAGMFARKVGDETFEYLKAELDGLLQTINEMSESGALDEIASDLGSDIAGAVSSVINLVKWLYEMKDVLIAGTGAVITYKTAFTLLTAGVSTFNAVKELFNIISGKSVLCKNLETGATVVLTQAEYADVSAKNAQIVAQSKLNAVCMANPYLAVTSLLLGLTAGIVAFCVATGDAASETEVFADKMEKLKEEADELTESHKKATDAIRDTAAETEAEMKAAMSLIPELETLVNTTNRTEEQNVRLNSIIGQLNSAFPDLKLAIDNETGALNTQISTLKEACAAWINLAKAKALSNIMTENEEQLYKLNKVYDEQESDFNLAETAYNSAVIDKTKSVAYIDERRQNMQTAASNAVETANEIDRLEQEQLELTTEIARLNSSQSVLDELGFGTGGSTGGSTTKPTSTKKSSGGTNAEKEAEKARKANVEAFEDYVDEVISADETLYKRKRELGRLSDDEYAKSLKDRAELYREFARAVQDGEYTAADGTVHQLELTAEEEKKLLKEYLANAEELEHSYVVAVRDAFENSLDESEEYIRQRNLYNDWGVDNELAAWDRVLKKISAAKDARLITFEEYLDKIDWVNEQVFSVVKKTYDKEADLLKERFQRGIELETANIEQRLKIKKAGLENTKKLITEAAEAELAAIDEVMKKREQAKEDEEDNTKLERLKYMLEYEHDEENRIALQKEIDELEEDIGDKLFEREMDEKKAAIEEQLELDIERIDKETEYAEAAAERQIERVKSRYESYMSDVNLANIIAKNLNIAELESTGSLIGEAIAKGISTKISEAVEKAVSSVVESTEKNILPGDKNPGAYSTSNVTNNNQSYTNNVTIASAQPMSPGQITAELKKQDINYWIAR